MSKPKAKNEKEQEKKQTEREALEQRPHFTKRIIKKGGSSGTSNIDR